MELNEMTTEQKWEMLGKKHELAIQTDREIAILRQSIAQDQEPIKDGED